MFKNYLKTAWRYMMRNKVYSALNVIGLAIGMAVTLLIGLWVYHQYSYDKFLPDYQRLYQVKHNANIEGEIQTFNSTSLKLSDALRTQYPEIEYVAVTDWFGPHGLMRENKKLYIQGGQVEEDFLEMFQFPLLQGDAGSVLKDPYSIVLTESTAKALFGKENPINKTIRFDNKDDLKVTGILKDLPANSTFQFHYLVPFSYYESTSPWVKDDRNLPFGSGNSYQQFVQLKPGISYAQIAPKIINIEKTGNDPVAKKTEVILQPLKDWHLYTRYENGTSVGGFIEYVQMFGIIGVFVLLIACINFVNLTTARSEKRAKEVGIRKVVGSDRKQLVIQFLTESFLLAFIAFVFSIVFVQLSLPAFNILTNNKISIPFSNGLFWMLMLGCVVMTALLAGSRPAFYLSSFKPVKVLKGGPQIGKTATLPRKVLVILQFSCSIGLIIATLIVFQQIKHAKERPIGYDLGRLLMTNMSDDLNRNYVALKNELLSKGILESITTASSPATNIYWHSDLDRWPGKKAGETVEMGIIKVSEDYFKTLNMKMMQGKDFKDINDKTGVILNETAIERLQLKDPINQIIQWDTSRRIVGVVKDALMLSPFAPADPTMFIYEPGAQGNLLYRLSANINTQDAINELTAIFNKYNPSYPYDYKFADASYAAKFNLEVLVGKLAAIFAGLAIFISCLGLFGLAAYTAEQRTKEIGIRKVLGASMLQVWILLSKDFITLVLISSLIASPVALYYLQNWLQQYEYRINISPWIFVLAALVAIVITLITISFQAIKAALANPVKSLRTE
ncbi:ABC transporter permease [Chitinophagaceae bacterium LB-8]|uniref:ABC transporter permease n=1 Tax=Paraflavisolibacter caeni TaxID=2982496 RepID=A0A9X3BHR9_9BACT|nr:ABC transporter permease [Paraflavisolibacter caeni]MCU7550102.1 ABC transporter permease [Paraflavisolibacter caeni]